MKIILLADVKNVGKKGEVKEVSDGYGRNYLIRNSLAVEASKKSMEILNQQKATEKADYEKKKQEALALKAEIESKSVVFKVKVGNDGRLFGSVSTSKIVEAMEKQYGITLDKKKFVDTDNLNKIGKYDVKIELFKEVIAAVKVTVESE